MPEPQLAQSGTDAELFIKPMPNYAQRIRARTGAIWNLFHGTIMEMGFI